MTALRTPSGRALGVAFDLDGTLASWDRSKGFPAGCGEWLPGAAEAVAWCRERGVKVLFHTCRCTWQDGGGWMAVAQFAYEGGFAPWLVTLDEAGGQRELWTRCTYDRGLLDPWGLDRPARNPRTHQPMVPEDVRAVGIWLGRGKPLADVYVDDRGMHFDGSWAAALPLLQGRLFEEAKVP